MVWKLTTAVKKNVTQTETWSKDGKQFSLIVGWRWGTAYFSELNQLIDLDQGEDECYEIHNLGITEDLELDDGCWTEFDFPDEWSEKERQFIEQLYEGGDFYYELEQAGWYCEDTVTRFFGPLELTKLEDNNDRKQT